jgi:hypothetical protein
MVTAILVTTMTVTARIPNYAYRPGRAIVRPGHFFVAIRMTQ